MALPGDSIYKNGTISDMVLKQLKQNSYRRKPADGDSRVSSTRQKIQYYYGT